MLVCVITHLHYLYTSHPSGKYIADANKSFRVMYLSGYSMLMSLTNNRSSPNVVPLTGLDWSVEKEKGNNAQSIMQLLSFHSFTQPRS